MFDRKNKSSVSEKLTNNQNTIEQAVELAKQKRQQALEKARTKGCFGRFLSGFSNKELANNDLEIKMNTVTKPTSNANSTPSEQRHDLAKKYGRG
jgi:hypothetical protein